MNAKKTPAFIFLTTLLVLSLACSTVSSPAVPVDTSIPVEPPTATIAATATQKPTSTPRPTATAVPPTATAAPVGVTVSNEEYEVNVIKVRKLGSVYLDQNYIWEANPGYLFLELGVQVISKRTGITSIPWQNIYVTEQDGNSWYPGWGGFQTAKSGENINPATIIFAQIHNENELVSFGEVVFLRLIWTIKDNNPSTVYFGFDTSPLIEVTID
ncbi:MAG: hypothetical protein OHK003_29360 [Anaerolineales bacterium]